MNEDNIDKEKKVGSTFYQKNIVFHGQGLSWFCGRCFKVGELISGQKFTHICETEGK